MIGHHVLARALAVVAIGFVPVLSHSHHVLGAQTVPYHYSPINPPSHPIPAIAHAHLPHVQRVLSLDRSPVFLHRAANVPQEHVFPNDLGLHLLDQPDQSCPFGWTCADIGSVGTAGSASLSSGTWTLNGSGSFGGTSDAFQYAYQDLGATANATVSARVSALNPNGNAYPLAGVMMREGTDPSSRFFFVGVSGTTVVVLYRRYPGFNVTSVYSASATVPAYVAIVRSGVTFTADTSADGSTWTPVPDSTLALGIGDALGGLAVNSGGSGLATATIDSVSVQSSGSTVTETTGSWVEQDLGSPQVAGDQKTIGGTTWEVDGAGTGPSGYYNGDQFRYVYQNFSSDSQVVASTEVSQMVYAGNSTPYTQGGLSIRATTDPYSPAYDVSLFSNGEIWVQDREYQGEGIAFQTKVTGVTAPIYLKVQRSGMLFTAYTSTDGTTWTPIPNSTVGISMPTTLAGIYTEGGAGGDGTTLANTRFDAVSVSGGGDQITGCSAPWSCTDMGGANPAGSQTSLDQTAWAINDATTGFTWTWCNCDNFHYVYQSAPGSGFMVARLTTFQGNDNPYGQAGIMIHDGTGTASDYYYLSIHSVPAGSAPNNNATDLSVTYRGPKGTGSAYDSGWLDGGNEAVPIYLLVAWSGGSATSYYSWDGKNWITVPNSTVPIDLTTTEAGLATVGGPNPSSALGTYTFDHVHIGSDASPPGSADSNCPVCQAVQAIDTDTGSFSQSLSGLAVPGRGLALSLTPTYDSRDAAQDSPLGYGWTHPYNMFLSTDTLGDVSVHEPNGSLVTYSTNRTNYYSAGALATLVKNGDGTFTFTPNQSQDKYTFSAPTISAPGQLLKETDRDGNTTALTYSGSQLSTVTDPAGRTLSFSYNAGGRIASITDSANRTVSFGYDQSGNLTSATDADNHTTTFTYDANHLLLTTTDPRGEVVSNQYDSQQRVISHTVDPAGLDRVTTFAYADNSDGTQTTTVTDPNNNVSVQTYSFNKLMAVTNASGTPQASTWSYAYNFTTLQPTAITDPNDHVWMATYDGNGNLLSSTDPLNRTWTYTYDSLNDPTSVKDPNGVTTTMTYTGTGDLQTVSRPLVGTGQTATTYLTYGDSSHPGDVTAMTDPNGHTTRFAYDAVGNLTSVTDPDGNVTTYGHDAAGDLTSEISPDGNVPGGSPDAHTATATYDANGNLLTVTDPLGNITTYGYDKGNELTSVVDAQQNSTIYTYDLAGELTDVTQPDGSSQTETYDKNGNVLSQSLLSSSDVVLRARSYRYDPLNRVSAAIDPDNRTTSYSYDPAGNLTAVVDAMSRTTSYAYDQANQLTGITYSDGTTPNVGYTYTPDGQLATMTDGTGPTAYTYDSLGRLTTSVNGASQGVDYGYDLSGNLTTLTYPGNLTVTRSYDPANQLTGITDWLNNTTHFAYDADGNLTSETFPSSTNVAANFTFNAADELTRIVDSRLSGTNPFRWTFGYGRDALGQVSSTTDQLPGLRQSYGYNSLNQLTSETASNRAQTTWTYDGAGNLTGMQDTGANLTETFGYDSGDNQLTSLQATGNNPFSETYSYNADGDRTGMSGTQSASYAYNQADELASFAQGTTSASYAYNGAGLRMSKTVNGTAENYVWDEAEGMPLIIQDGSTKYITGPRGLPVEQVDGSGTVSYYLQDQLGSTRGLIDSSGTIVGTYQFGAYGNLESHTGVSTPFGYAGQYTDAESGFQYLRARYYDPATDQFLTVDPLASFTEQPYAYSPGDPLDSIDPYGLFCISSLCSDSVTNAAGNTFSFIGQNAGTIVPVAIYVGAVGGMALCAFVTAGLCIGADVAAGGALFGGGTLLTYALLPPGEGPAPEDAGAALPVGRKGCPISVFDDVDTDVNGRMYSGHAVARMQGRGFTPTVVDNVLARGTFMGVSEGKDVYYDSENNITVLTNGEGKVVSVGYGKFKVRP